MEGVLILRKTSESIKAPKKSSAFISNGMSVNSAEMINAPPKKVAPQRIIYPVYLEMAICLPI